MSSTQRYKSRSSGVTVSGELVVESHTAYQVAVDGQVQVLLKEDWFSVVEMPGFEDLLGTFFGARG